MTGRSYILKMVKRHHILSNVDIELYLIVSEIKRVTKVLSMTYN